VDHRLDRRTFLGQTARTAAGLAVVGATGSALAACGSSGKGGTGSVQVNFGHGVGTGKPVMGGSLIFGTEAEESGFDPTYAHFDSSGVLYARTVYDPLAIALPDGSIVPYLAQSITSNTDYTQWTITLRPNLFFHDGTPCDGKALEYNFNAYKASPLVNFTLTYMEKATQTGALSVRIDMNAPWVPFPAWLAGYIGGQMAYVFSPAQYAKAGNVPGTTALNSHPVGTGPFIFKEWVANDHFTATRNTNYWRKDKAGNQLPYLDQITFKPLPIVSERWTGLQSGTLDIIHTDDPRTIIDIRDDTTLSHVEDDDSPVEHDMDFGMINCVAAPFDDVRMRQAFACAFNQANYLVTSGLGVDKASTGPFTSTSQYFGPTGYPAYNPAKAKQLIQAYMSDHHLTSLDIIYGTTNTPEALASAGLIQQYMQETGISGVTVTIQQVEQSEYITDAILGSYHVYAWRQFANIDPDLNYVFWAASVPNGGVSVNFTRLRDQVVQQNIDKARQTTDQNVRIEAYQAVAQQFGDQCPYIWAAEDIWSIGAGPKVQNFNNPTTPDGVTALGMLSGIIWPTEIWKTT
jgi:peptide/nickel transport system substrate-binding protein